jgi:two-component system sensor histidine kinase KdpD
LTRRRLQRLFGGEVLILFGAEAGTLDAPADLTHEELARAEAAWQRGYFSARASGAERAYAIWVPVLGTHGPLAVIGLKLAASFDEGSEQGLLLSACARELAAAIERTELAKTAQRAQLDAETERMRSSLLSAVSHDLKTPLAGIVASGSTLLEHEGSLDARASTVLVSAMVRDCERLAHLLQNLLSMSRLESPTIELRKTPEAVEDIVAAALSRVDDALSLRQVNVDVPADLPWVFVEPALIEQVLLNLLENALRYTPASSSIEVSAHAADGVVKLRVSDDGPGIAEREREKVFQEFFRGSRAGKSDGGVGLGLPICRAVVRAHGGSIAIRERQGGGALVEFTLPITQAVGAVSEILTEVSA